MNDPKFIAYLVSVIAIVIVIADIIQSGKFVGQVAVLSLTLIAVVWYTYFTYLLVHKKEIPSIKTHIQYDPYVRGYIIFINNLTNQSAKARLWLKVQVNGSERNDIPEYCGDKTWNITPDFEFNSNSKSIENHLIELANKSFEDMVDEASNAPLNDQFRLSLRIKWKDMDGVDCGDFTHYWWFDFQSQKLAYQLGGFSDWE